MIDDLNDENFILYAMKAYDKPNCILSEFEEDLRRIRYIKRLIRRYKVLGEKELKERLILNHIIVLSNVFGVEACVRMLFFKLSNDEHPVIKSFLLFLNYMPTTIKSIKAKNINSIDIPIDILVLTKLRTL